MAINNDLYKVRHVRDLKDMLNKSSELFGSRNAFYIKRDGNYTGITYNEFKKDVDSLGTALLNLGLKGKHIAVIGENSYEWCVSYLAVVCGVGVVIPLDKELPKNEIENLLNRSKASAIIYSGKLDEQIRSIAKNAPSLEYIINMELDEARDGALSFKQLISEGSKLIDLGNVTYKNAEIDPEKMSILLFTSGTTDIAKGVMLSHKNICSNFMAVCKTLYIDCNDSVLSMLPLHHTYECTCGFLLMIYNGCCISFIEGLKHISKNLQEVKPTILLLVPLIIESMYKKIWDSAAKKPGLKRKLKIALKVSDFLLNTFNIDLRKKLFKQIHENVGGRVRLIISGAAAINPEVSKGMRSMGFKILQGYGLTECSPIVTVNIEQTFHDASIGLPLPGIEVKLEDVDNEGIGEIVVKGDNVMLGYYQNEAATSKVLKDGWFFTGDLGYKDKDGFYYITGRKKNVIVTKNGKNIFPEEVEAYLNNSPYIFESLVWGKDSKEDNETYVYAQIVPDYEAIKQKLKKEDIADDEVMKIISSEVKAVNHKMPLYKCICKFDIRQDEFAKTTTKKIKRYSVDIDKSV
ncbi:MAG TPA: AMP-binding protein [Clostridiaceae bacterium]|nr:AMP-binding protein [Clostridiaceae bacterium]